MALFKCSICNYMVEVENELEHNCPKCGAKPDKFNKLDEEAEKKVYDSEYTNDLLMELDTLVMKLADIAQEGIDINLDPTCLKLFEYTNDKAWEIKQIVKAEIENHINKGKW